MRVIISVILFLICSVTFAQNKFGSIANPKSGECYVRCFSEDDNIGFWSKVDCELVKIQRLRLNFNAQKESYPKQIN